MIANRPQWITAAANHNPNTSGKRNERTVGTQITTQTCTTHDTTATTTTQKQLTRLQWRLRIASASRFATCWNSAWGSNHCRPTCKHTRFTNKPRALTEPPTKVNEHEKMATKKTRLRYYDQEAKGNWHEHEPQSTHEQTINEQGKFDELKEHEKEMGTRNWTAGSWAHAKQDLMGLVERHQRQPQY